MNPGYYGRASNSGFATRDGEWTRPRLSAYSSPSLPRVPSDKARVWAFPWFMASWRVSVLALPSTRRSAWERRFEYFSRLSLASKRLTTWRRRWREAKMQNILVVDDEPDVRDSVKYVLDRAGYSVRTAESAMDALAELARSPTDLVITDIIMPQINGVEAIESIRKAFPAVRIIAISGGGNFGITEYQPSAITTTAYLASAEKAGAHLVLTKPFETVELIRSVEQVLGVGHA